MNTKIKNTINEEINVFNGYTHKVSTLNSNKQAVMNILEINGITVYCQPLKEERDGYIKTQIFDITDKNTDKTIDNTQLVIKEYTLNEKEDFYELQMFLS